MNNLKELYALIESANRAYKALHSNEKVPDYILSEIESDLRKSLESYKEIIIEIEEEVE